MASPLRTRKRAVNVSVSADLLDSARSRGINLSAILEAALELQLRTQRREEWLAANAAGIDAYNRDVDEHGVFGDSLREF